MRRLADTLTTMFAAGCLGGLANSLAVWLFGVTSITKALGVNIAPALTPSWLYPRLVWGGIWGIIFALPILPNRVVSRGILLSLAPTIVQLVVVFPLKTSAGMFGLGLGTLTPLFVLFFNAVWGLTTALWLRCLEK